MLRVYAGSDPLTSREMWKARSFRGSKRDAERALAAFVTEQSSSRPAGSTVARIHTVVRSALKQATQIYLHGDLTMKQRALDRTTPPNILTGRFKAPDPLFAFLDSL